jgi:hypothetical protein
MLITEKNRGLTFQHVCVCESNEHGVSSVHVHFETV